HAEGFVVRPFRVRLPGGALGLELLEGCLLPAVQQPNRFVQVAQRGFIVGFSLLSVLRLRLLAESEVDEPTRVEAVCQFLIASFRRRLGCSRSWTILRSA